MITPAGGGIKEGRCNMNKNAEALGKTNEERLLHVTFTFRGNGTRIRIISARSMHRKERSIYEQKKP